MPITVVRDTAPRSPALPRGRAVIAALGAGGLVALSLPPFGFWPLGLAGLAVFALLLVERRAPDRAIIGAGVGVGQYLIGLWWVTGFNVAGYVALVVHGSLCTALAGSLVPRRRLGVLVGLPAGLVVSDWIRGRFPFGGLPLGGTALGQAGGPFVPAARIGGSLLITATVALMAAGLAELLRSATWDRDGRGLLAATVAVTLALGVAVAGRFAPDGGAGSARPLQVALVQGGGPRGLHAVESDPEVVFQRQIRASDALTGPVDLVLWPEDVLQVDRPVGETPEGARVARLAQHLGTTVVVGVVEDEGPDRFRNAAVAWAPTGTIAARYDKVHRVPFGEYVPLRSLFGHLADLSLVPRDAIPGRGTGLLPTPAGRFGVVLSYEVFFDSRTRSAIRAGGQVLLVPTNASSYRISQVPTQEVAAARLAAWATGRDALQAAPTGYSAIIDHRGKVVTRSVLGRQQVLVGTVRLRTGRTLFVRLGDVPLLLVALIVLVAVRWLRRAR